MTTTEIIGPDLKTVLRRLKLGRMLDTLPERVLLARQQKMPHQDFLLLVLSDEATRRDNLASPCACSGRGSIPRCISTPGIRPRRSPWIARS
jgi:hypothetical protein